MNTKKRVQRMHVVEQGGSKPYVDDSFSSFLSVSPFDPAAADLSRSWIRKQDYDRQSLADVLQRYNQSVGNDSKAIEQVGRLRNEKSVCVVTGQQLGLCGGPAYTVLKAVSCCLLAKKYDAVPIFWAATEDHDVSEIDHTYLLDNLGNLNKVRLHFSKGGSFVEDLLLSPEHLKVIRHFAELVGQVELFQSIEKETSYSKAMIKVLLALFKGTGLVFVEPRVLRPLAKKIFAYEISNSEAISTILQKTTQKFVQSGGSPVLDVSQSTNLFFKSKEGFRLKILCDGSCYHIGSRRASKQELLDLIEVEPERFSTNAAARCIVQNTLFPVLAYIAGPSEIAYHRQLKDYHACHGVAMPWLKPRLSMTIVPPVAQEMMKKLNLQAWDAIPCSWSEIIPEINEEVDALSKDWLQSAVRQFGVDLSHKVLEHHIRYQVKKLQRKAVLSRLRKRGVASYALNYLNNLLHPRGKLQERVVNWWEFQTHTEISIIYELLNLLDDIPRGHLYCYL